MATEPQPCEVDGCKRLVAHSGKCSGHLEAWRKYGKDMPIKLRSPNAPAICKVDDCSKPKHSHGLCQMHNRRRLVHGDPLVRSKHPQIDCRKRWIAEHVNYEGDDCLKWPFSASSHGRGLLTIGGRNISAPRAMCIAHRGDPPSEKHETAHSCGNGHLGCMNPRHLSWKTAIENQADKVLHGTLRKGEDINTSILTEEQVREIRRRLERERGCDLANEFEVSQSCISDIKLGRAWKWLK